MKHTNRKTNTHSSGSVINSRVRGANVNPSYERNLVLNTRYPISCFRFNFETYIGKNVRITQRYIRYLIQRRFELCRVESKTAKFRT